MNIIEEQSHFIDEKSGKLDWVIPPNTLLEALNAKIPDNINSQKRKQFKEKIEEIVRCYDEYTKRVSANYVPNFGERWDLHKQRYNEFIQKMTADCDNSFCVKH